MYPVGDRKKRKEKRRETLHLDHQMKKEQRHLDIINNSYSTKWAIEFVGIYRQVAPMKAAGQYPALVARNQDRYRFQSFGFSLLG